MHWLRQRGVGPLSVTLSVALLVPGAAIAPGSASPVLDSLVGSAAAAGRVLEVEPEMAPASPARIGSSGPGRHAGGTLATVLPPAPYKVTNYMIRTLAPGALPYVSTSLPSKTYVAPYHDADGIPMKLVGTKLYYSPAGLVQFALRYEDAYRRTKDPGYLAWAAKVHRKVIALSVLSNAGLYIPYRFDFAMHRIATEVMKAPWYSAMAQGLALSLAVRLYRDTGDPVYLADATKLFTSFKHVGRGTRPWVTYIDAGRYLWLEEYPENLTPSDHTANGFFFAIFGLYDYYQETHDPWSLRILRASITTMRQYIGQFRRPGTYSKYCLRHGKPQAKYHKIVTWQLAFLAKMSGDPYFQTMSRTFFNDYH